MDLCEWNVVAPPLRVGVLCSCFCSCSGDWGSDWDSEFEFAFAFEGWEILDGV